MNDDVDRIMAVMQGAFDPAFGEAWTRRQLEDSLVVGNCHYLLAGIDGQSPSEESPAAAGFALSRTGFQEEELLLFAVLPDCRRRGVGRTMLRRFADAARGRGAHRLYLEMRRGNPAEYLYREFGFTPVGERPNYYRSGDGSRIDAITFACSID